MSGIDLTRIEQRAAEAVERYARTVLAESRLYGREHAMNYALGYAEPIPGRTDAEELAKIRGVFAGLRAADVLSVAPYATDFEFAVADQRAAEVKR